MRLDHLESKKTLYQSCISNINQYLHSLFRNSRFNASYFYLGDQVTKETRKEEPQPQSKPKSDEHHQGKPKVNHEGNEASGSNDKGKMIDDDEEEEVLSEGEKLIRKKRDKELDDIERVRKELEAQEREVVAAKFTLKTQESIFPPWNMERIQNEAIDNPSLYWLEPLVSFDLVNSTVSQFGFLVTPRAFLFRCFNHIERESLSDYDVNHMLFSFYIKYGKSQL
ncbi:unnamed protein product [Lactuca saligna]|uniref:Uncharacterized protein n=1 Tax=Lactuca saligna TaxID=75948 RepID=A0AA35ZQ13_LACSI|nr:unnamed protein product [Lactuca saligna]